RVNLGMLAEEVDGGETGGHGEGIAAERAGLIDGAEGRDQVHDLRRPAVGADGEAAADDLAERGEVGRDVEALLRAAEGEAEAGHDLVEDEERAVVLRDLAQEPQVASGGRDTAHIADYRLDDDAGDVIGKFSECL